MMPGGIPTLNVDHVPQALRDFFAEHASVALAFSGGCDSAYLLYAARACGARVTAYYVATAFQPQFERRDARKIADMLTADMKTIDADVLAYADICANGADRCYLCKHMLFDSIIAQARSDGYDTLIDGTNASDPEADRPGMRALRELRVLSPLRLCGIDKSQVRARSRDAGLFTWNKPAYACLATRIPMGTQIDGGRLARIERAEAALSDMGFSDFRVREADGGARLELTEEQMPMLFKKRAQVLFALGTDYPRVTLDLQPRKGQ